MDEKGAVPGIDVRIVIGDDRTQVDWILSRRLFRGEAVDCVGSDESCERLRGILRWLGACYSACEPQDADECGS